VRNDEITLKGSRNALLPTLDVYGFYGSSAIGGAQNPKAFNFFSGQPYPPGSFPTIGYSDVFTNLFNSSAPDKGAGFTLNIPVRNRQQQSVQERSLMEYRQAELRLEQLYTQIRMQVVNAMYAINNDRAAVQAAEAARDFNQQSLDAEEKKLRLGASTTANVLEQQRNLAVAEANMIAAHASYANDRARLYQILATTMQHYGINLDDAAKGVVSTQPVVTGVQAAPPQNQPSMTPPATQPPTAPVQPPM
jgi:outer membrane protein TolC